MERIGRRVAAACLAAAACGLAAAGLFYANAWWLSGVMTVSIACWLAGVLAAVYGPASWRGVLVGALAASFLYVLLAQGPWFRANVGPWLLTTRGLAAFETKVLGRQPPPALMTWQDPSFPYPLWPSGSYIVSGGSGSFRGINSFGSSTFQLVAVTQDPSVLVLVGHWFCGWIAAALGGLCAAWMIRRRQQSTVEKAA